MWYFMWLSIIIVLLQMLTLISNFLYSSSQNLYWADSGDLVAIASDSSFYILKYNVRTAFLILILTYIIFYTFNVFEGLYAVSASKQQWV